METYKNKKPENPGNHFRSEIFQLSLFAGLMEVVWEQKLYG